LREHDLPLMERIAAKLRDATHGSDHESLSPEGAFYRALEAVARALEEAVQESRAAALPPHSYLVVDGEMRVAVGQMKPDSDSTVDLYRNLDDLRAGRVMESGVEAKSSS
jgi:hypothetical protein